MNAAIVTRESIARQARRAAAWHAEQPQGTPQPPNPYCPAFDPDHHREWAASFARYSADLPECEGSC
jgi:hypothetical protein